MSVCAKCDGKLELAVECDDEDEEPEVSGDRSVEQSTVPDDVHLKCGHHFHWECLVDTYELDKCPKCMQDISSQPSASSSTSNLDPQILVDLNNEGGLQQQIDIFPILKEESYLRAYPEERKCRAFLEFCREGDYRAVVDLLHSLDRTADDDEDENMDSEGAMTVDGILRYQDPIGDMQSGLHAAAAGGNREIAWLLLLLASNYPELDFPALVFQEAAAQGVMRDEQDGKVDIRSLEDAYGRTAEDVARENGVVWHGWIGKGRLRMP